jgi:hypothetical protein
MKGVFMADIWRNISLKHIVCNITAEMREVDCKIDGKLKFTFYCRKCSEEVIWWIYPDELRRFLFKTASGNTSPPSAAFTDCDWLFLKGFRICERTKETEGGLP